MWKGHPIEDEARDRDFVSKFIFMKESALKLDMHHLMEFCWLKPYGKDLICEKYA